MLKSFHIHHLRSKKWVLKNLHSASFRILNRVVHKVTFWAVLVPNTLILNKMLKIEWYNFKFLKIEWCTCTTWTISSGGAKYRILNWPSAILLPLELQGFRVFHLKVLTMEYLCTALLVECGSTLNMCFFFHLNFP